MNSLFKIIQDYAHCQSLILSHSGLLKDENIAKAKFSKNFRFKLRYISFSSCKNLDLDKLVAIMMILGSNKSLL